MRPADGVERGHAANVVGKVVPRRPVKAVFTDRNDVAAMFESFTNLRREEELAAICELLNDTQQTESLRFVYLSVSWTKSNRPTVPDDWTLSMKLTVTQI